ncbi:signal peptidase II [Candidatus Dependentiae bacterium]|nr:signal peptidase II [Candidatus Dependentiae bacterium]
MMSRDKKYLLLFLLVLFLDRVSKGYAIRWWCTEYMVNSLLSFHVTLNRGISWGLFNYGDTITFVGITALILLVTGVLTFSAYHKHRQGIPFYGELLVIAGSCSNIFDRFLYGGVIDFISVHVRDFLFPVFNVADCFIVLGVFIMFKELFSSDE